MMNGISRARRAFPMSLLPTVLLLAAVAIPGCSTNPVTRERELVLVSTAQEIGTGKKYYGPVQQAQGGRYTANPALNEYVTRVGQRVARVSDRKLPYEFVVLNSGIPNAWALPGGKIAINRGLLLEMENEAELAAVLAHEVVHAAARHGAQAMTRNLLLGAAQLGVALAAGDSRHANYIVGASGVGMQLVNRKYSRDAEDEADRHGMRYMHAAGYDTRAAVTLQEKFLALKKGRKANWLAGLFATHPPSEERVANNRRALARFPGGGDTGRARYDRALADLRAKRPAYEAADRARERMATETESALALIEEAIRQEPREASFHGLKGQVLARRTRYSEAVSAYDDAIARDAAYYEHFLGRGLAHEALGNRGLARRDLERSMELLPTALASYTLGHIVLAQGDRARAKSLFGAVTKVRGDLGDAARKGFALLDVADAPGRYVEARPLLGRGGQIAVELINKTPYPLADVVARVEGRVKKKSFARELLARRLAGGARIILNSGLRHGGQDDLKVQAKVLRARAVAGRGSGTRPSRYYP